MLIPKVIYYSWIALKDSCLTQNDLMMRNFKIVNRCYICLCNLDSIYHLFFHCTTGLWNMFFYLFGLTSVKTRSMRDDFVLEFSKNLEVHLADLVFGSSLYFVVLWDREEQKMF